MSKKSEVITYCATMVDDDTTQLGGAIDKTARPVFTQPAAAGTMRVKSENTGDTTQTVTIKGNRSAGKEISEDITPTGQTWAGGSLSFAQLSEVSISASHAGAIGVCTTATSNTGTAQGGGDDYITLAAGASAIDNAYQNQVVILDDHQIRRGIWYDGTTKKLYVWPWTGSNPTGATTYEVSPGVYLDKAPHEVNDVIAMYRKIGSPDREEADPKVIYGKAFLSNESAESKDFTNMTISETDDTVTSGTAQGGGDNYITVKADDTGGDDDYKNMFVMIVSGTGSGQIKKITSNTASTKKVYVSFWTTNPDATSVYRICTSLRDKAVFALEDAVNDNGVSANRLTLPTGVSAFSDADKVVPGGGALEATQAIGLWLKLTLNPGDLPAVSYWPFTTTWLSN